MTLSLLFKSNTSRAYVCYLHNNTTFKRSSFPSGFRWVFRNDYGKGRKPILLMHSSRVISGSYVGFGVRAFHLANVHEMFYEMPQRDGFIQRTRFEFVLDVLRSSVTRADALEVMIAHCLGLKIGVLAQLQVSTMLLTLYGKTGNLTSSLALFDEVNEKDLIVWNAVITCLVQNQSFAVALDFFVDMICNGSRFDSTTLLLAVSAVAHMKWLRQGRLVHGLGIKAGMVSDSSLCNALVNMYVKCGDLHSGESTFVGMEYKDLVSWNTIVTGCLANNYHEKCLWYFKQMTRSGEVADNVSLSCTISASTCLEELDLGQGIHGLVIKLGSNSNSINVSIANSLITMYSRFGDIDAAEEVFRNVLYKDIVSWNSMIDGFASNGMVVEAFDMLNEMQFMWSVQPDIVTVVTMIPLCAKQMLIREGRAIHGYTIRRQMGSNVISVTNSLIDMYMKCNLGRSAELLFKTMPERDLVSWNTMISGYSENGHKNEAKILFKDLLYQRKEFSLSTVLAILPSCDSSDSLAFGKSIHCWQVKLGLANLILSANSLMNMYISCGDLDAAFFLLHKMSITRDVASWNTVIYGCASKGHYSEALRAFSWMRQEGNIFPNSVTFVGAISACGNLGLVLEGKSLHCLVLKTLTGSNTQVQNALITMYGRFGDIESAMSVFSLISKCNLCSWNCMISALSQNKAGREAFELFQTLDLKPNEITIVGFLSACTQLGFLSYGMQMHCYLIRHGFRGNPYISAALIDMFSSCGKLDLSLKVFRDSEARTIAAWNSMISAYGFHGDGGEAIKLFQEMCMLGLDPDKSTFISLLSACGHSGFVDEGLWYYNQMSERYGVEPVTEHQVCVVDMLGRSGRLNEAYEFIKQIRGPPRAGVWGAMLSACNYNGDTKMGKQVAELLFKLEPENAGYYISLSNMYVAAGRWKDAMELRQIVQDKRLRKPAGMSLIDVGVG